MATYAPLSDGILEREIDLILQSKEMSPDAIQYECFIHTEFVDTYIDLLNSVEILRDYKNNIADYIIVSFLYPMGDYLLDIVKYSDNLEFTIKFVYYGKKVSARFKAVLLNFTGGVSNTKYENMTREQMNNLEKAVVEVQCLDRLVEYIRTISVEGVVSYSSVAVAALTMMKEFTSDITVDGEPLDLGFNFVSSDNKKEYRHIQIPYGTGVFDIPSYLQNTDYGFYNTDIGTYFQTMGYTTLDKPADYVFIYNLYDNTRYETDDKKLMIISSNTKKYEFVENTFVTDGSIVKILASSVRNFDTGEKDIIDSGNSIVDIDPGSMIQGTANVTNDKIITDPSLYVSGKKSYEKRDGVNRSIIADVSKNQFKARSEIIAKQRKLYQFEWRYCNHDLIFPGMPVGYVYNSEKFGIVVLKGVVNSVFIKYNKSTKTTSALVNCMLESPISYEFEARKKEEENV